MRKLRSILARVLIAGLIGVVVTETVAVWCAMRPSGLAATRVVQPLWCADGESDVLAWYAGWETPVKGYAKLLPQTAPSNALDGWGERRKGCPWPRAAFPARGATVSRSVIAAGWPCMCLWGGCDVSNQVGDTYPESRVLAFASTHKVGAVDVGRPFDFRDSRGICGQLPIAPIGSGLAINTLFYGTIAWAMLFLPGTLRRWRRARAGRCVKCGYDRAGLAAGAACPECGGTTANGRAGEQE